MNTTEILDALVAAVEVLKAEHTKTTKVSRSRARSVANVIKKLAADFKRTSTAEDKAN
jgi:hypothetical protein